MESAGPSYVDDTLNTELATDSLAANIRRDGRTVKQCCGGRSKWLTKWLICCKAYICKIKGVVQK